MRICFIYAFIKSIPVKLDSKTQAVYNIGKRKPFLGNNQAVLAVVLKLIK